MESRPLPLPPIYMILYIIYIIYIIYYIIYILFVDVCKHMLIHVLARLLLAAATRRGLLPTGGKYDIYYIVLCYIILYIIYNI